MARSVAAIVTVAFGVTGCNDAAVTRARPDTAHSWVAGEAAAALSAEGRFEISGQHLTNSPEINQARALALAEAYLQTYGTWLVSQYEEEHGGPVVLSELKICGDAPYAETAYDELPATVSAGVRKVVGPHFLVTFCDRGAQPAVSVAVSSLATALTVSNRRLIGQPDNDFVSGGVMKSVPAVPTAEAAALMVTAATGRRVTKVPALVQSGYPYAPQHARWMITLDQPVTIAGSSGGKKRAVNTIAVGAAPDGGGIALLGEVVGQSDGPVLREVHLPSQVPGQLNKPDEPSVSQSALALTKRPAAFLAVERVGVTP